MPPLSAAPRRCPNLSRQPFLHPPVPKPDGGFRKGGFHEIGTCHRGLRRSVRFQRGYSAICQMQNNTEKQVTCNNRTYGGGRAHHCDIREQTLPSIGRLSAESHNGSATIKGWMRSDRQIYTHTGWRIVDGRWLYLHAGGAIGVGGTIGGVNVRLPSALNRYELRPPIEPEAMARAVRASIRLVELGPASISFPLRAATCRSVFGDSDFSIHLAGEAGAFKSEVAALEQRHFRAGMNRKNPGTWSSTACS
jgi:hypothetical protein